MTNDIVFIALLGLIIILIVERHILFQQAQKEKDKLLEELSKAIKAVIAKNANDYVMTASIDKVPTEEKPKIDPDLVSEDELTDEEFMQSIKSRVK